MTVIKRSSDRAYFHRERCPICDAPRSVATAVVRSEPPAESLPFDSLGVFHSGYDSRRVFFTYHRCATCRGLYCPIYLTPAQLDLLYGHQPENRADVPRAAREATLREYLKILRRHTALDGDYLELGPDIGLFARLCADAGRLERLHLFEPNRNVHAVMADRLAGRSIRISSAACTDDPPADGSVSTAVAIHVLDHVIDPAAVLRSLYSALKPGGTLFVATHDEASLLARALGRRWPPYTLQHPQLFTPESTATLLARCGFSVVESRKTPNYFPVTHLVRSLFTVFGMDRFAPTYDHPFMIRVPLGNIVTVARRT